MSEGTGNDELDKAVALAGYAYDPEQDIFFSIMNPWQRDIGYCRLYDEMATPMGMIIDCEPIFFSYQGKTWMIGLWKGQYDLVAGGEIGVYTRAMDFNLWGVFNGAYYDCAGNADLLPMSFTLKKNGQVLFAREDKHWWLTGFKLGEFTEPSELSMDISITLPNEEMRAAFLSGLWDAGYSLAELTPDGLSVSFTFAAPHTAQPLTRTILTDRIVQRKNKLLCELYQNVAGTSSTTQDKIKALEQQYPDMYEKILRMGKAKPLLATVSGWLVSH